MYQLPATYFRASLTILFFFDVVNSLTINDHFEVTELLRNLNHNDLIRLGGALGLSYPKLKKMEPLCEDMVLAWLTKEDHVIEKSGEPSWDRLIEALRKIGQTGLADTITQGIAIGIAT